MKTLGVLPISTKNMLEESRVLTFIQRWAQSKSLLHPAEMDGYSSENTSRAQTPLNTPDGSSTKMGPELDADATKPAVFRRLKIISENSLDSALSDASKASDGKEEDDDEDDEEEDESSLAGLPDSKQLKADPVFEAADPTKDATEETEKEVNEEKEEKEEKDEKEEEAAMSSSSQDQAQIEEVKEVGEEMDLEKKDIEMKEDTSEVLKDELQTESKETSEEQEHVVEQTSLAVTEKAELESDQSALKIPEPESPPIETEVTDLPSEQPLEQMEPQTETQEADKPLSNDAQSGESTTDALPSAEIPEATIPSEVTAAPVDPSLIGTPSQDEEEGVSDVESERSQEPQLTALDICGMATRLLESWKDLKVRQC